MAQGPERLWGAVGARPLGLVIGLFVGRLRRIGSDARHQRRAAAAGGTRSTASGC